MKSLTDFSWVYNSLKQKIDRKDAFATPGRLANLVVSTHGSLTEKCHQGKAFGFGSRSVARLIPYGEDPMGQAVGRIGLLKRRPTWPRRLSATVRPSRPLDGPFGRADSTPGNWR